MHWNSLIDVYTFNRRRSGLISSNWNHSSCNAIVFWHGTWHERIYLKHEQFIPERIHRVARDHFGFVFSAVTWNSPELNFNLRTGLKIVRTNGLPGDQLQSKSNPTTNLTLYCAMLTAGNIVNIWLTSDTGMLILTKNCEIENIQDHISRNHWVCPPGKILPLAPPLRRTY